MKKLAIILLKAGASLAILTYLIVGAQRDGSFSSLLSKQKDWTLIALAAASCSAAVMLTMVRWGFLVRAVGLPFSTRDAFRLGFLGYLFNLAPMGVVGGDLLKAGMLAWEHPGNKGKAVASVVVDRLIGLYVLFVVAAVAIVASRFWALPVAGVRWICAITILVAVFGGIGLTAAVALASPHAAWARRLGEIPRFGHHLYNSVEALAMYRSRPSVLVGACLASVAVHSLFCTGIYLMYCGLRYEGISLVQHFVIMPLTAVTALVPLSIGPFEVALQTFYRAMPVATGVAVEKAQGLIVALGYRIITVLIAAVGAVYYLSSRREVASVMGEVERHPEDALDVEPIDEADANATGERVTACRLPRAAGAKQALNAGSVIRGV